MEAIGEVCMINKLVETSRNFPRCVKVLGNDS